MTITHHEMVMKLAKPGYEIGASLSPTKIHVWHMASCIMGEAGELLAAGPDDRENMIEELGDLEFYLAGLRDGAGISYDEVASTAFELRNRCDTSLLVGLVIEAANIFDATKKWIIYQTPAMNRDKLLQAMGRFEFYSSCIRASLGIYREEILAANMAKLAKRYGPNYEYTNQKAQVRADKGE